jgi:tight adherence protein C
MTINEWMGPTLLGLAAAGMLLVLLLAWLRARRRDEDRRLAAAELDPEEEPRRQLVFGPLTHALAGLVPMTARARADLQRDLRHAGYYRPTALAEYTAVRAVLVLGGLLVTGLAALLAEPGRVGTVLLYGLTATLLGYSVPRWVLLYHRRVRARQIQRGLPLAIDLLTLCLSAGQNLLAALTQTSRELRFSHPVLAQELTIIHKQAQLRSLDHALKQWPGRVNVPEVTNLALLLVQSERLGTDTAATLVEMATNFRVTARQRAEAHANRTSFWLLFPSVFCFWVAAGIILIGPAYLEFFQYRVKTAQFMNQARTNIQKANDNRAPQPTAKPRGIPKAQ